MRHSGNQGMALILTLMVVTIITAMVVEFAYGVYVSTSALSNWQTSQRLSLLASSATQLGSALITEKTKQFYTTALFETTQKAPSDDIDATITLRIEDENAKFNLNTLRPGMTGGEKEAYESFMRLLEALEIPTDKARDIAGRICYWVYSDTRYRPADGNSKTKDAKLDSIDELLLIPGIDNETYEKLLPHVTIYGNNRININTAGVHVLLSLPGDVDKRWAESIIRNREIEPFDGLTRTISGVLGGTLNTNLTGHIDYKGYTFRMIATASSGDVKRIIETVVDTSTGSRNILYWREL